MTTLEQLKANRRSRAAAKQREFAELKTHHAADIQRLIADKILAGDDVAAAEVVGLAFEQAQLDRFDPCVSMLAWFKTIAINRAIDYRRANENSPTGKADGAISPTPTGVSSVSCQSPAAVRVG